MPPPRTPYWRLALFAAGDFAFNLFWQSVMLYLLFYWTEVAGIAAATAGTILLVASVYDGLASFAVGVAVDRGRLAGRYAAILGWGAVPLGASFALVYLPGGGVAMALVAQVLFRTAYALLNIPYAAMSARVSRDSDDRALVAGLRMLAGTLAAVTVAGGTVPLGRLIAGGEGAAAYFAAATAFGVAGAAILALVAATFHDAAPADMGERPPVARALCDLTRNRAYATLMAAMAAMIVAVTLLDRSVLYYFKYALADEAAGRLTLASMAAISGVAVPVWMLLARRIGARGVWFAAAGAVIAGLALFAAWRGPGVAEVRGLLVAMQAAVVGLHFAFWALLPDAVDWGRRDGAARLDGIAFGLAALGQRMAIGAASALLGLGLGGVGEANAPAVLRITLALAPLGFFALSALVMLASPLRQARG